jgi:hypothetical protein
MKKLLLLIAMSAAGQSPRPTVEIPAELTSDYFKQAYVIEHAIRLQNEAWLKIAAWADKNVCTPARSRDANDELVLLCLPKDQETK